MSLATYQLICDRPLGCALLRHHAHADLDKLDLKKASLFSPAIPFEKKFPPHSDLGEARQERRADAPPESRSWTHG